MRRHRCDRTPGSSAVRDRRTDHANDRRDVPLAVGYVADVAIVRPRHP